MKKTVITIFIFLSINLSAQNFLGNAGFEEINQCEEYGASCAPEAWFRIPPYDLTVTDRADRKPHNGHISELVVIENIYNPLARRIFLYTQILCPLQKGKEYQLSIYIDPIKLKNYKIEFLFSKYELIAGVKNPLRFDADLVLTKEDEVESNSKSRWKKVEKTFIAKGDEKFLTIGNFSLDEVKVSSKEISNQAGDVVLLIDDIQLIPMDENEKLCEEFMEEKLKVYNQNYRHTNKISINGKPISVELEKRWGSNFLEKPLNEKHEEKEEVTKIYDPVMPDRIWEDKDTLVFEIPNIAFDFDRSQIKGEFKERLDLFAAQIEYLSPEKIQFVGHTDSMGPHRYNKRLSEKRAKAVQEYLNQYQFFRNSKIEVIGMGENTPKATNKTIEGRQLNRRVEIVIYRNKTNFSSQ